MRKLLAITTVVAVLAALAITASSAGGATKSVRVGDNFFSPSSTSVSRGTLVRWRWVGSERHNVVATRGAGFRSSIKRSGTFSARLRRRGTVRYICTVHPSSMRGTIRVR